MRNFFNVAIAALVLTTATMAQAGCFRCDPVYNVVDAPVTTASGKALTDEQVKSAIVRAGAALGWQMKEEAPGLVTAKLGLIGSVAPERTVASRRGYPALFGDGQIRARRH